MAGKMGNSRCTKQGLLLYKIDPVKNLLYVRGAVPGHRGALVEVRDSKIRVYEQQPPRPAPTFLGQEVPGGVLYAAPVGVDPYDYKE